MGRFPHEIGIMNMVEFNALLAQLGKKVAWEIELTGFSLSGKLDSKFNPLVPDKSNIPERKVEKAKPKKSVKSDPVNSTAAIVSKVNSFIKR
jgi:hypothetical protein